MKKLIAILIGLIFILAIAVPAAADVDTSVTVSTGAGTAPILKAKWEYPDANPSDDPVGHPTQIRAPAFYHDDPPVEFWAVAADTSAFDVVFVDVDIWHPDGFPLQGSFKDEVKLYDYSGGLSDGVITTAEANAAIATLTAAYNDGVVVTAETSYTLAEMCTEIAQGKAWLYKGTYNMLYHQPFGSYKVEAFCSDKTGLISNRLLNHFDYLPATGLELDINGTTMTYSMSDAYNGLVDGDYVWSSASGPTMRNIGNTFFDLEVRQDDAGLGYYAGPPVTWKVQWDCRIGSLTDFPSEGGISTPTVYDPSATKANFGSLGANAGWRPIPGTVHLCNFWKLDFSVHVLTAVAAGAYTGKLQLRAVYHAFDANEVEHPTGI